jgi:hypothetical protein
MLPTTYVHFLAYSHPQASASKTFSYAIGVCWYGLYRALHGESSERRAKILSFICEEIFAKQTILQIF